MQSRWTYAIVVCCALAWAQNVGIGTSAPAERLHVNGRIIAHDGLTGTPQVGTWGSAGSRLLLWPGDATTHPYQIGIAPSTLWYGVPQWARHDFYIGEHRAFRISPTTESIVSVNGNINYPSIFIGNLANAFNATGPYPTRGTFLIFGGPTNTFPNNTDPVVIYFAHLANDQSRLRLHVEDNGNDNIDGFSIS